VSVTLTLNSKNFVTGATNVVNQSDVVCSGALCFLLGAAGLFPLELDIDSLWTQDGEEGLLASADPLLEAALNDLGAAILTIGDESDIEWFQQVLGRLTISFVQAIVPTLLNDLKGAPEPDVCEGLEQLEVVLTNVPVTDTITAGEVLIRLTAA